MTSWLLIGLGLAVGAGGLLLLLLWDDAPWLAVPLLLGAAASLVAAGAWMTRVMRAVGRAKRDLRTVGIGLHREAATPNGDHQSEEAVMELEAEVRRIEGVVQVARRDSERARAVLDAMSDGVLIFDGHRRLVLANRAALAMLDLGDRDPAGSTPMALFRRHEIDVLMGSVEGRRASAEIELSSPLAGRRTLRLRVDPMPEGGVVLVARDVTEARRADAVRRDFVANVSHELRTPLASLRAMAEALQQGGVDDAQLTRRFIDQMVREIERLTRLVNDLLDLSTLESGTVKLRPERLLAAEMLEDVAARFADAAAQRGVSLRVRADDGLTVTADRDRLEQALGNLVDNAMKFASTGGTVELRVETDDGQVRFVVEDDGPGIAPEHLPRIFERFYRADAARARGQGGTGLGLAIVKHIVTALGGRVEASSRPEGGARFAISLPRVRS